MKTSHFFTLSLFIFSILNYGCTHKLPFENTEITEFLTIKGGRIFDSKGRHVILHGVNMVNKNKSDNYLSQVNNETFKSLKSLGFNCIRLGIIWDGLESEPNKFNENYLKGIDTIINLAKQNGIYVFLDMHQDLYGVKFGDGAPAWATLDENKPHINNSPVWSDAYFMSPAVQTAFDNFWNNKQAADGIGLQDHFANAWVQLAKRYMNEPAVIGYDIMNEPFLGSKELIAMPLMFLKFAKDNLKKGENAQNKTMELMQEWSTVEGRNEFLTILNDTALYAKIIDTTSAIFQEFESTQLTAMYQKVANKIRSVDKKHILFLGTGMSSNMGIRSGIKPIMLANGMLDSLLVYAPHGYDLVVDTKFASNSNNGRVELIFRRHEETRIKLKMPMLVGEWGAYYGDENCVSSARFVNQQFEKYLCGDTYWEYVPDFKKKIYAKYTQRSYPMAVPGEILHYKHNFEDNSFECAWKEDAGNQYPAKFYLSNIVNLGKEQISIFPKNSEYQIIKLESGNSGYILVNASGKNMERSIRVRL